MNDRMASPSAWPVGKSSLRGLPGPFLAPVQRGTRFFPVSGFGVVILSMFGIRFSFDVGLNVVAGW
jgi:hypothetical protein